MDEPRSCTSVAHTVFSTPELFEWILLNLLIKDLIRAGQVTSSWLDMINASTKLQQKLFLKPMANTEAWILQHQAGLSTEDPNTVEPVMITPAANVDQAKIQNSAGHVLPVILNPLLMCRPLLSAFLLDHPINIRCQFGEKVTPQLHTASKNASCRRMYLCQPPVKVVELSLIKMGGVRASPIRVHNPNGVRYGQLLHEMEARRFCGTFEYTSAYLQLMGVVCPSERERKQIEDATVKMQRRALDAIGIE